MINETKCASYGSGISKFVRKNQARVSVTHSDINNQLNYNNYLCLRTCRSDKVPISLINETTNYLVDKTYDTIIACNSKKNSSRNSRDNYCLRREASVSV